MPWVCARSVCRSALTTIVEPRELRKRRAAVPSHRGWLQPSMHHAIRTAINLIYSRPTIDIQSPNHAANSPAGRVVTAYPFDIDRAWAARTLRDTRGALIGEVYGRARETGDADAERSGPRQLQAAAPRLPNSGRMAVRDGGANVVSITTTTSAAYRSFAITRRGDHHPERQRAGAPHRRSDRRAATHPERVWRALRARSPRRRAGHPRPK